MEESKKKTKVIDTALLICLIFALVFTVTMIVLFCIFQSTPDVLIGSVFTALFGELGCCALIQKSKNANKTDEDPEYEYEYEIPEEEEEETEDEFAD